MQFRCSEADFRHQAPWSHPGILPDLEASGIIGVIEEYNRQQGFREVTFTTRERQKQAQKGQLGQLGTLISSQGSDRFGHLQQEIAVSLILQDTIRYL